jgi:hypothetical protein
MSETLARLRSETANWSQRIRGSLQNIVDARLKEIAAEKQIDKSLRFRVD